MFETIRTTPPPARQVAIASRGSATKEKGPDLPCPWCHADTDESDPRCPSCGRRFG